ncbi:DUF3231 family protein [Rossellomorea aquimaris]|uniref:DUF3231 family protein n=1 Tax=Rossellomorea aquimaris TaxID=189382 RepID=UPI001CD1A90A|nr:DUF3231 family protein [Rossellomorea aquimaris]MCA1054009.1 DUF3231 family protein [Rossellomorea aquimaris]
MVTVLITGKYYLYHFNEVKKLSADGRIVPLTSGEIGVLWSGYIGETVIKCVMESFTKNVEDRDSKKLLEMNQKLVDERVENYKEIFNREGMKVPKGFGEEDVFLDAPRMFSDKFYLFYLKEMSRSSIINYSNALFASHRRDIRMFLADSMNEYLDVFNAAIEALLEKGIVIRTPSIPIPKEVQFVQHKSFLGTLKKGANRPISALEIKEIYINLDTNMLGKSLMIGFSQSAKSDELREYLLKGRKIAHKHIEIFINRLTDEDLPSPQLWDPEVSESKIPPFSDKLMHYHTGLAAASGLANYGTALSQISRKDLTLAFARLVVETGKFSLEGANLSIKKGWLEQPPLAPNRDDLSAN